MSDLRDPGISTHTPPDEGDHIGPLLRLAGPREAVPEDRMRRVRTAVHTEWRQQTRARSRRAAIGWSLGAFAAAALLLIGVRLSVRDDPASAIVRPGLATIETLTGAVRRVSPAQQDAGQPALFEIGDSIRVGDGVNTMSGGLAAFRLPGGVSVRVDRGTELRLLSARTLELETGAIYVDSGNDSSNESVPLSIEVRTPLGVARDVGTRFEVRVNDSVLRVRVRDGLVEVSRNRQLHDANPGDELTLDGGGNVVRQSVPVYGADWAWVAALARPFDLEGRTLRDFLDWIAGENGWQLRFADSAVEQKAVTTILHGSIRGLTPNEALAAVLPASGVEHQLENGVLLIQRSGDSKD